MTLSRVWLKAHADSSLLERWRGWQERAGRTLPGHMWRRANELDIGHMILALGAQQMLCTAPLLVAVSSLSKRNIGTVLGRYLGLSPTAAADVHGLFASTTTISRTDTLVGIALALVFATGVAATQQRGYEQIWSLPRAGLRSISRHLIWVAGLSLYLVVVLYAGRAGHRVGTRVHAGRPAGPAVQLIVSTLFFWWSQRLLLQGRVSWKRLFPGGLAMAVGMTVLVAVSGPTMSGQIVSEVHDYGLIGATFILSVWLVVLSGLIFTGALLGAVISERHDQRALHAQMREPLPGPEHI